jgi:hypothetical protein
MYLGQAAGWAIWVRFLSEAERPERPLGPSRPLFNGHRCFSLEAKLLECEADRLYLVLTLRMSGAVPLFACVCWIGTS